MGGANYTYQQKGGRSRQARVESRIKINKAARTGAWITLMNTLADLRVC